MSDYVQPSPIVPKLMPDSLGLIRRPRIRAAPRFLGATHPIGVATFQRSIWRYSRTLMTNLGRRRFLGSAILSAGFSFAGLPKISGLLAADGRHTDPLPEGKQVGIIPFQDEDRPTMDVPFGEELDGRLYTDLSVLNAQTPVTPTDKFYLRTRRSKLLPETKSWTVKIDGLVENPSSLKIEDLKAAAKPAGVHLMECSGNVRYMHFGMLSVAKWSGVPVAEILQRVKSKAQAHRVLISGFDQYEAKSASSVPGASWIFTPEQLKSAGAFLASEMNEQPLTPDHGSPVRLVVPGWYGCACIKWVDTISVVDDRAEATSQMQEYAARTQQDGVPALASDYQPAIIEQAAMPIRVEKWLVREKIQYRLVGILWGGSQRIKVLQIRFNPEDDYVPVDYFEQPSNDPWSFWSYAWTPKAPGTYAIRLAVKDPPIRARRLDAGYYVRSVQIDEV